MEDKHNNGMLQSLLLGGGSSGGGSGSGLPPVTAADDGKVLGVKDGVWDAVTKTLHVPIVQDTTGSITLYYVKPGYEDAVYESVPAADVIYFVFEDSLGGRLYASNAVEKVNADFRSDVEWTMLFLRIDEISKYLFYSSKPAAATGVYTPDAFVLRRYDYNRVAGENWYIAEGVVDTLEITLTPTAQDMSGTMDYSPEVIYMAYRNGARIRANVPSLNAEFDFTQLIVASDTIICCGSILYTINGQDVLIKVVTDPSNATYSTTIYPLTAM